jgi:hypothetical protein
MEKTMPEIKPPAADPVKSLTQHQKIVAEMCKNHTKDWWLPSDFMQGGEFFVGYEASARLSELQRENPTMFDSRRSGKFMERRIMFETGKEWYPNVSTDIQLMVKRYYKGDVQQQPVQERLV